MKKFDEKHWNGIDDIWLYTDVRLMPTYPVEYPMSKYTQDLVAKMGETDPMPFKKKSNPVIAEIKQANRRVVTREIRRELAKADKALRLIKRTKSAKDTNENRHNRHEAKSFCREYMR